MEKDEFFFLNSSLGSSIFKQLNRDIDVVIPYLFCRVEDDN